jgi:L-ascorbate metabolism protein UlaG (beta-lactamase superfamily)
VTYARRNRRGTHLTIVAIHFASHRRPAAMGRARFSEHFRRAPETARFLRQAAPALIRRISDDCKREISPAPHHPALKSWTNKGLHAAWLGHSTVLLMLDGFTILTDPVFSARVGLSFGPLTIGVKRLVDIAAPMVELPPIDLILLSHAHMDHFDLPTLRQLENPRTQVVTAHATSDLLRPRRYARVHELRWNQNVRAGPATITAFQVAHWGARMRSDVHRGYNGYLLEAGGRRIIFGGDTAYTDAFKQLHSSRRVELAIMPVGAYDPWIRMHCNPEQAWAMANDAGAEFVLPVHHQTFELSREPQFEPIERLVAAAGSHPERVCVHRIGEEFHL